MQLDISMNKIHKYIITTLFITGVASSCKTIEKSSSHGLSSGYYGLKTEDKKIKDIYLDLTDEQIDIYPLIKRQPGVKPLLTIPLINSPNFTVKEMIFKKESLDIDITSILLKHRPSVGGLPGQINTDFNIALFVGWRYDNFRIMSKKDPLGKSHQKIGNIGYDFGFFTGPGTTIINPFTTNNRRIDEYSGMILQAGFAGFIESNIASFGVSIGYDYLMNSDRKSWIYHNKPWVGFIVGFALN